MQESIQKAFLYSPFIYWGIAQMIIAAIASSLISNQIIDDTSLYQLYFILFFPTLTVAFVIAIIPIKRGMSEFAKHNRKTALIFLMSISMIFWIEGPIFFSEIFVIMGELNFELVKDKDQLEFALDSKTLFQFIGVPFLAAYIFYDIKSKLNKEGYAINGKIRENLSYVYFIIAVNTGATIIITYFVFFVYPL